MVKNTKTSLQQLPTNCLSVFDHSVGLAVKGLITQQFSNVCLLPFRKNSVMKTLENSKKKQQKKNAPEICS